MLGKLFRLWFGKPKKEDFFVSWHAKKSEVEVFQDGRYILEVTPYRTKGNYWDYTLGKILCFDYDLYRYIEVANVMRNYHQFWHEWVLNHPDGHDYLFCGEDYQGVTVIRLDTGERYDSKGNPRREPYGFCWAKAYVSPDKTMMAVSGCYWAAPYEVRIYDITKPLEPFNTIDDDELVGADRFLGWNDDNSCRIRRGYDVRKSDGKPYHLLTDEEQEEVDNNWRELEGWKEDEIVWRKK